MYENIEQDALQWLKRLARETKGFHVLRAIPHVRSQGSATQSSWDWAVEARTDGSERPWTMLVDARRRITPQVALGVLARLKADEAAGIPLLCCPDISPRVQQLCCEHGVNYLDESGNCRVAAPGLFIERQGLGRGRRDAPSVDVFAPKASRIVRLLLTDPSRGWQVQELANQEGLRVSLGLASRVKQALVEQGYVVERGRRLHVRNPDDLLQAWAQRYRPQLDRVPLYVAGSPEQAEGEIARWCDSHNLPYALTEFSGAWRTTPAVRYQRSTVYVRGVDDEAWDDLRRFGGARRAEGGANLTLWIAFDEAVLFGAQPLGVPAIRTVSPLQLYLDLRQLLGRGEEAAQAVHETRLAPTFAAAPLTLQEAR